MHPAIVLRRRGRRAPIAVMLATIVPSLAGALGAVLYVEYSERLRPGIFQQAPSIGLMFERKEHLAFAAIAIGWLGAASYFGSWRAHESARDRLHALAHRAFVVAGALAVVVACLGTYVASYRTF